MAHDLMKQYDVEVVDSTRIIDYVDLGEIEKVMAKIAAFQAIVQRTLRQNLDFGIIPGTGNKPTLLKPGAEKIMMLLGIRTEFDWEKTMDIDKGLIHYLVKAKLFKGDVLITEGIGTANTKENKYAKQNPYSVDNTILKMAKKRALVDAALLVGSLSDIFTQDLEDLDLDGNKPTKPEDKIATDDDATINKKEAKALFAAAMGNEELVKAAMSPENGPYRYTKSAEIKRIHYSAILADVTAAAAELAIDGAGPAHEPGEADDSLPEGAAELAAMEAEEATHDAPDAGQADADNGEQTSLGD